LVERGPEKAGVGGSIPSLATNPFNNLAIAKNIEISSREQYANIGYPAFALSKVGSSNFHISRAVPLVLTMLPRQLGIAFRHLDIRVAQDLCQLVKIAAVHHVP
jgi:hypothetical protein